MMEHHKRVYMQLGDGSEFESEKAKTQEPESEAREEIEDTAIDKAIDKLFDGVEVLDIGGGMVTIAMPVEMLKILKIFSKLLINQERGIER